MTISAPIIAPNLALHKIGAKLKHSIRDHRALRVTHRMATKLNCGARSGASLPLLMGYQRTSCQPGQAGRNAF